MTNVHVKFESDWAKTVVAIVSTRQSVTEPRTHARTHPPMNPLTQPPTNGRVTISPPTLLQGDNKANNDTGS